MSQYKSLSLALILGSVAALAACGTSHPGGPNSPSGDGSPRGAGVRPIGSVTTSSTIALARIGEQRLAFVADEDAKAILTLDPDTKKELASTSVGGTPGQILVTGDGRILVTVRETSKVLAFQLVSPNAQLAKRNEAATAAEPIAMALTLDGSSVLVSSGWGRRLTALDVQSLTHRYEVKLPREPRAVVVSDDGKTAFVSHAVGSVMSTVDLGGTHATQTIALKGPNPALTAQVRDLTKTVEMMKKVRAPAFDAQNKVFTELQKRAQEGRESCQGFALAKSSSVPNRIFGPQVMVDPGNPEQRAGGYGDGIPEVPAVAVIDEAGRKPLEASLSVAASSPHFVKPSGKLGGGQDPECLLPRAAAIDPNTQSLFVTCFGTDSVIEYDATAAVPTAMRRHEWTVGSGPTGIAIDPDRHQAVVFSQFDRSMSTISLRATSELVDDKGKGDAEVQRMALTPIAALDPQRMMGRMLFHASGDNRIAHDGRACASCHPDGRDDAITWATPDGPRRSIMLAGRVKTTPPYSWAGNANTIQVHLQSTFKRLRGQGLKAGEVDALVAYITSLPPPPSTGTTADAKKLARGKDIFQSADAACATCHSGNTLTDGAQHDVVSAKEIDEQKEFNTPSLHLVGGTGPYFHDGRYATLHDLLKQTSGTMGKTSHLSPADLDALETYVESL
jgi:DNA-binding beta-propeller fold protein YncE